MFFKKLLVKSTKIERKNAAFFNRLFAVAFFCIAICSFQNKCFAQGANYLTSSSPNSYTLFQGATTSAGVYRPDSTLVRTLWSAVYRGAGTYQLNWDGKDDLGNQMPAGNYIIKVLADNVVYTWMGVVGNTSDSETGNTVHRGYYYCMGGLTIVNGTGYYCKGYSEGSPSIDKFFTAKPQEKVNFLPFNSNTSNTDIVASDGKIVYWAAYDATATKNSFIYGTNVSNDSYVTFSGGILFTSANVPQYNAISVVQQAGSLITGLAVQKAGGFLFVARAGLNQLSVLNKTTGALVQTITVPSPKALCVDMNDNLWMVSGNNQINKYAINANGTLSAPVITITSVLQPVALAVSPDNKTLATADAGITSQQVKGFDNATGKPIWTLGTPGGYMQDATVNNNKFYFNDVRGIMYFNSYTPGFLTFIAYQPDGSFWVNDPGNYRVQHYTANRTYIETIMSMGSTYSSWADKNDNTRVGAEYLEFKIDNTQPITGNTGWQLVKNWGANIPANYDRLLKITNFITLTSGAAQHTYGFLHSGNFFYLVEFQANNSLRFTNIVRPAFSNIDKDGSLLDSQLNKYAFLGFDNLNNPIWATTPQSLGNILLLQDKGPLPKGSFRNTYLTSTGKVIFYDYGIDLTIFPTVTINTGFHLGAIQAGPNININYLWETGLSTHLGYKGFFPDPSHFDIGNGVNNNAGSGVMVSGRNIIACYHGEGWKNAQTNMYNHYLDNGLAIGQFGTVGPVYTESPAMMAGNALSPQLVTGATPDELYLWHGDESYHAGLHKWKISGLSTIVQQDIPIVYPSPALATVTVPGNSLMVNLPYSSNLLNNTSGWTISPAPVQKTWTVKTNVFVSGTQNNPDVYAYSYAATGAFSLNRDLGNNTGLSFWTVDGQINYFNSDQGGQMQEYVDILDNKGKIIARLTNTLVYVDGKGHDINTIYGNGKVLVTGLNPSIAALKWNFQNVSIGANNNLVTISYAGYSVTAAVFDPTADITSPATLRCYFTGGYNPTGRNIDFKDMRFITAKTNQTITFMPAIVNIIGNPTNTIIAVSSSNLPVTFTVVSGPATVNGNVITLLSKTGTVVIQASQPGNNAYNSAAPVMQSFILNNLQILRIDL